MKKYRYLLDIQTETKGGEDPETIIPLFLRDHLDTYS